MSDGENIRGKAEGASSLPPFLISRKYPGPGPQERKRSSRLYFWFFRRWPDSVVAERLFEAHCLDIEAQREMDAWMKQRWVEDEA